MPQGSRLICSIRETAPLGAVRDFVIQSIIVGIYRSGVMLLGQPRQPSDLILHFKGPKPECFKRYIDRLPPAAFNQLMDGADVAQSYVGAPLAMSAPLTAKKAAAQCEQDFTRFNQGRVSFSALVSSLLKRSSDVSGYPTMDKVAQRLLISTRTLTRRLDAEGQTFAALVDERRCVDAQLLLSQADVRVSDVAMRLGYADSANFTRAFRKWTGQTPSAFRQATRVEAESALLP